MAVCQCKILRGALKEEQARSSSLYDAISRLDAQIQQLKRQLHTEQVVNQRLQQTLNSLEEPTCGQNTQA